MTQGRLAERSGLSADTIRRLEHGAFSPSLDTLTKLCVGLQITRSTLFESFELGECDLTRELLDLLGTRTRSEVRLAFKVLQVLFDDLDGLTPEADLDDAAANESSMPISRTKIRAIGDIPSRSLS